MDDEIQRQRIEARDNLRVAAVFCLASVLGAIASLMLFPQPQATASAVLCIAAAVGLAEVARRWWGRSR